ncbi:hypothetical protein TRAPUB_11745 [Trametes pubescens]|uniref:Uncharacterized protein n=1 Tax=Trametes pubescens TaxID=154538 RepID=A0A1M2VW34_TRAPU|nr:hypothetical protein TRAPUB_11745 [Trametes pubescens]
MGRQLYSSLPLTPSSSGDSGFAERLEPIAEEQAPVVENPMSESASSHSSGEIDCEFQLADPRAEALSLTYLDSVRRDGVFATHFDNVLLRHDENLWMLLHQEFFTRHILHKLMEAEYYLEWEPQEIEVAATDALATASQYLINARTNFDGIFGNTQNVHLLQRLFHEQVPELGPPPIVPTGRRPLHRRRRRSPSPDTRSVRSRYSSDEENQVPTRPATPHPRNRRGRRPSGPRLPLIERLESLSPDEAEEPTDISSNEFFDAVTSDNFCLHCVVIGHNYDTCPVRQCMHCQETGPEHREADCLYRNGPLLHSRSRSGSPIDRYELLYPDEGDGES